MRWFNVFTREEIHHRWLSRHSKNSYKPNIETSLSETHTETGHAVITKAEPVLLYDSISGQHVNRFSIQSQNQNKFLKKKNRSMVYQWRQGCMSSPSSDLRSYPSPWDNDSNGYMSVRSSASSVTSDQKIPDTRQNSTSLFCLKIRVFFLCLVSVQSEFCDEEDNGDLSLYKRLYSLFADTINK